MERDKVIFDIIEREHQRQQHGIELIASENFVSDQVGLSRTPLLRRLPVR